MPCHLHRVGGSVGRGSAAAATTERHSRNSILLLAKSLAHALIRMLNSKRMLTTLLSWLERLTSSNVWPDAPPTDPPISRKQLT